MALMETKIIQVDNDPDIINNSNEEWGYFGWSVLNVQVTHSQNTKTYTKGYLDYVSGDKTVETTTLNYATITYQRDKHMPNYQRLVALESEYAGLMGEFSSAVQRAKPSMGRVLSSISPLSWLLILFLMPFGIGWLILIVQYNSKKNDPALVTAANQERVIELGRKREAIIEKASALLV